MKSNLYQAKNIAVATNRSVEGINKRIRKEGWPVSKLKINRGQQTRLFKFTDLPADIQIKLSMKSRKWKVLNFIVGIFGEELV